MTEKEPNIFVVDKQNLDIFAAGDGFETEFCAKTQTGCISHTLYLSRNPVLPMLAAGTWLEIYLDLKIGDERHDTMIQIVETHYDPLNRKQIITLGIPSNDEEITDSLASEVTKQLEEWFGYNGNLLDDNF
jgi:hypothetical protein